MGMPIRYHDYLPAYESLNQISTIGSFLIGFGFLLAWVAIIHAVFRGPKAPMNPWGSKTLEWTVPSPPPHENFETVPTVTAGPYEFR